jgi:hypothetical protein
LTERHTFLPSRSILVGASESAVADHIGDRNRGDFPRLGHSSRSLAPRTSMIRSLFSTPSPCLYENISKGNWAGRDHRQILFAEDVVRLVDIGELLA